MEAANSPRPPIETVLARALRLRCPRCGQGKLFVGWFRMPVGCPICGLRYERAPGYFLGSTYINYATTALAVTVAYITLHAGLGLSNRNLAGPLAGFCVVFPLLFFRYARSLWLALDSVFDRSGFDADPDLRSAVDEGEPPDATPQADRAPRAD